MALGLVGQGAWQRVGRGGGPGTAAWAPAIAVPPVGPAYRPAAARRAAALSVRSQVNSGSLRPKWP